MTLEEIEARMKKERDETLARHLAGLQRSADELAALKRLMEAFPDLTLQIDRWEKKRFTSADVNPRCEKYELLHNCGCCDDSPLELWPYVELDGVRIFARGIPFTIGDRWPNGGEDPYYGWEEKLRAARLPESLTTNVTTYFAENPRRPYEENDDEADHDE